MAEPITPDYESQWLPAHPTGPASPVVIYLASLGSNRSRETQLGRLHRIAQLITGGTQDAFEFRWERVTYEVAQFVRTALSEEISTKSGDRLSPAYVNAHLAALRSVLKETWRLGLISEEQRARACDLQPVRGSTLPAGRSVTLGEKAALSAACQADTSPKGARDAALFAIAFGAGLRRAELVDLEVGDFTSETGELRVRRGKGRKARIAHVSPGCRPALDEWMRLRGDAPGPLLCPVRKGGAVQLRRMTDHAVFLACRRRAVQAGIKPFSPHDMRRTFIGDLLDAGADISVAQQLAGHASVSTTQKYDRRPEARKRQAAERLHFPWR
ncbi:MAG: site-specific integrase [Myxococcota bacterium]